MKLRSLSLNLFRQHTSSHIEFSDGLVGVIGGNGAGKTTIVEAIGFAIYGSRALRGRIEDVRTRSAPAKTGRGKKEQDLRVDLSLEHDGVVFRIERSLTDASLFIGGESQAVAVGGREVAARMSAIVGMTYEEFIATYCTEQKGFEFLRMMGYDRLEKVQEALRLDRREKRAELSGWEASIGNRADIEARLQKEANDIVALERSFGDAVGALERAENDTAGYKKALEKLEVVRAPWVKLQEALKKIEIQLGERRRRFEQIERERIRVTETLGGSNAIERSRLQVKELGALSERVTLLEKETESLEGEVKGLELSWREGIARAKSDLEGTKRQLTSALTNSKKRGELKAGSRCPTCDQELGDSFESVRAHAEGELKALQREVERLTTELERHEAEPTALTESRGRRDAAQKALGEVRRERDSVLKLERSLEAFLRLEGESVAAQKEIAELESEREALSRDIKQSPFSEESYTAEKTKYDAASRLLEVTRLQKVRAEGELQTHRALKARTEGELRAFDERAAALVERRKLLALLDDGDQALTDFRKHLNASIRPRLTELASEFLAELTDGRYTTVEIGADFTPTVIEDGEPKPIISGGEEDILNLCLRLALSNMLAERAGQSFSLLMLDEVFGSLDEGRRTNVLGLLEKLNQRFEQILVITHLDDIKEGVQSLIEIEYDDATGAVRVGDGADFSGAFEI